MFKRHLTLTWLILAALLLPSIALGALREPGASHATQGNADAQPQAPETLTWRQRTAEEWAASDFEGTQHTPNGVALSQAVFQRIDAGDYDDISRYTTAMIALDADGDGDADLAIGNESPLISDELLLNDGHGIFSEADAGDFDDVVSELTVVLAAFDADGDQDVDLIMGSDEGATNALFLNDGAGSFDQAEAGDLDDTHSRHDGLLPFDADGDGDMDLAVSRSSPGNALFLNDGAGRFALVTSGNFSGSAAGALVALDADRDGDLDVALPGRLYRNNGAGTLALSPAGDFDSALGADLVAFDANRDGDADLAVPGALYLNDGAGSFSQANAGGFNGSSGAGLLALDTDADGDLDLVVDGGYSHANAVYANNGSGVFAQVDAGDFDDSPMGLVALVALDADRDGRMDLAAAQHERSYLFRNQGGMNFEQVEAGDLSNEARYTVAIAAFDANGDAVPDLAIAGIPNALFLNDGAGRFGHAGGGDYANASYVVALAPFDADGDGDLDLATGTYLEYSGAANRLYLNDGAGRLMLAEAGDFDDPILNTLAVTPLDADGDGDLDLAVGNTGARNALYLNDGQGSFTQAEAGAFDDLVAQTKSLLAFDADGDGDTDLSLLSSGTNGSTRLYVNDGAGSFDEAASGTVFVENAAASTALDADGDGDLDLAILGAGSLLAVNDGQGRFRATDGGALHGESGGALAALDYDHDGDVDLAIRKGWGTPDVLLANDGSGQFVHVGAGDLEIGSHGPAAPALLDADQDGDLDLVRPGQVLAYENLYAQGSVTSPIVDPVQLYPTSGHLAGWQNLALTETLPASTDLRYDVLDGATGDPISDFVGLRPNAGGQIGLGGINPSVHPAIRLRAKLFDTHVGSDYVDQTPWLVEWSVTFSMATEVPPPRTVDAYRVSAPPAIDGNLADWPALPLLVLDRSTAEAIFRVVPAPADSSAELRALWSGNALYVAVHVRDDVIVNDSGDVWRDDEIELAFDAAHDLMSGGPDDHQFTVNADGRLTDGGAPIPPGTIAVAVAAVAGGWDVEARLPIHALQSGPLFAGRRLGFTLGLHDDDDGGDWDSYMIWEGNNTGSGAAGFGLLRLVDAYQPSTWQQHTYRDWFYDGLDRAALANDSLAVADAGQFPGGTPNITVVEPLDVDGDGDTDLAVGANGVNGLYKNNGSGQFIRVEAGAFDDLSTNTLGLVAFDADGDGDLDLAESNGSAPNAIFVNNGAGIFTRLTGGDFGAAGAIGILLAFDANRDGRIDLAGPRRIFLNGGAGSFTLTPGGDYSADLWAYTYAIVSADLDGDGDADLAVGNAGRQVNPCQAGPNPGCDWEVDMLYLNNGSGSFTRSNGGTFGGNPDNPDYTVVLAAFDADADGDVDLVKGNQGWCWDLGYSPSSCTSQGSSLYLNDGAGVFSNSGSVGGGWMTDLVAADLDGDGDADVATANEPLGGGFPNRDATPNSLYLNDGSGHFAPAESATFQAAPAGRLESIDADGDGAADILLSTTLFRSKLAELACVALADAGFSLADSGSFGNVVAMVSFDADGDGDYDLAGKQWLGNTPTNVLYVNDGSGAFSLADPGELDDPGLRTAVLVAFDADGDGDLDLAAGNGDWQSPQADALYLNDGHAVFTRAEAGAFDDPVTVTFALAAFDTDGDGDIDLVAGGRGPEALYLNDGHGTFALAVSGDWATSAFDVLDVVAFDADGDGDLDLLPATYRNWPRPTTMLYRNDGNGSFAATDPGAAGLIEEATAVAVLDADRDGDTDVVMGTSGLYGGLRDALLLNDGAGRFTLAPSLLDLRRETDDAGVLDVEGDGDLDVVATSEYGWGYGTVLLLNDGAGHLTLADGGDFEGARGRVVILDADGDGDQDIWTGSNLYENENLYETGRVVSPVISPQDLYPDGGSLAGWNTLKVTENLPDRTTITYDVLDPATARPIPGFAGLRPNAAGQIGLAGIDPYWQRSIQLRANLADQHPAPDWPDYTPQLCGWQVSFRMEAVAPPTPTPTRTTTATPSPSPTPTRTATATPTTSSTPTSTASPTATLTPTAPPTVTPPAPRPPIYLPLILHNRPALPGRPIYLPLIERR